MKCPHCNNLMFVMEYDGLETDVCASCAGVWFDADELALLFDGRVDLADAAIAALPTAITDEAPRKCPHCRRTMRKVNIGTGEGVLIDACAGHGLFFDRGEVAELARLLEDPPHGESARLRAFLGETFNRRAADNETEGS